MNDMRKLINLVESKLSEDWGPDDADYLDKELPDEEESLEQWKDNYNKGNYPDWDGDYQEGGLPEVGDMYKGGMVRNVIGLTDEGIKTTRPEWIDHYKIIVSGVQGYGGANGDHQYFVDKTGQEMNEDRYERAVTTGLTYKIQLSDEAYQQLRRDDMRGNAPVQKFKQVNGFTHIKSNNPQTLAKYLEKIDPAHETSWTEILDMQQFDDVGNDENKPVAYAGGATFEEAEGREDKLYRVGFISNFYSGRYHDVGIDSMFVLASSPEEANKIAGSNLDAALAHFKAKRYTKGNRTVPAVSPKETFIKLGRKDAKETEQRAHSKVLTRDGTVRPVNLDEGMNEAKVAIHPVTGKRKRFPDSATRDQIMAWKNSTPEPKKKKRSFSDMAPDEIDSLPTNTRSLGDQARMEKMQDDLEELSKQQEDYMQNWRDYGLDSPEAGQAAAEELQPEMDNLMRKLDQMQGLGHFHEGVKGPHVSIKLDLNDQEYRTIRQASMRGKFNHDFSQVNGVTKINTNAPNTLGKDLENLLDSGETSWYEIIRGQMTGPGAQDIGESFMDILTRKGLFK
jgi:hypothetical protein